MFEIVQHTADVRLQVKAPTQAELFSEALRGLMVVMKPEDIAQTSVTAKIHLDAPDSTALLIDFLNEVLTRCHIRREIYPRVLFRTLTYGTLDAELEGHPVARFGEDVKAVTYHEADVRERDRIWSTNLVFDV